ncbi:MAG: trigger factor [Selenomonadaceae bacterium]|nr:trigger factor [Selenomonadaceae bacterium]
MKTSTKKIDNYESEITVEIEAAELEKAKKRACKQLSERTTIPGFRKGKVPPLQILEQHFGKGVILEEAADILIQKAANDIIKEEKIIPVTQMKRKIVTLEDGKDFIFTLTFTTYPEVKLGEYKGLKVEKIVEPVTDEMVDEQVEHMRTHHANMIDAPDAEVADGDFVTLDFVGTVDGEKFQGGEAKDHPLEIGSHSFIGDFEEQLIGLKVGDEKDVKVTFPENYHAKDLADKPAVFHCKINSIKHKELPELNDEFAKKVSKFETLADFKADIKKNMEANAERRAVERQQQAVIEKAVENMTVDVPPIMIEERITQMIQELTLQLQSQGMKLEQYLAFSGLDIDALREQYKEAAKQNTLTDILLDEVAHVENITASNEELNYELAIMAQMYRTTPKQIYKILQENRQLMGVANNVLRRKVMRFLVDNMAKDTPENVEKPAAETKSEESKKDE